MNAKAKAWLLVGIPALQALWFAGGTLDSVRFQPMSDEGFYLHYAKKVAAGGRKAFPGLFQEYAAAPSRHVFPPPSRVTVIAADAVAVRFLGGSFSSLQSVSFFSLLALVVLLFRALAPHAGVRCAWWTSMLVAASPLQLGMAQRALSDSLVGLLSVACLLGLHRLLVQRESSKVKWSFLAALYAAAFLAREGSWVLAPISLLLMPAWRVLAGWRPRAWAFVCVSLLPLAVTVAVESWLAGGWRIWWEVFWGNFVSPASNSYALRYGGGPWFRYLLDFLLLSPWTLLLFVAWSGTVFCDGRRAGWQWFWVLVPVLFLLFSWPMTKNVRYALFLDVPIRLGAVLFVSRMTGESKGSPRGALWMALILAGVLCVDLHCFFRFFVVEGLYDPMTFPLLAGRGLLPR